MDSLELTTAIATVANLIACNVCDNDELNLIGSGITQLGDTVLIIVAQRTLCDKINQDKTKEDINK